MAVHLTVHGGAGVIGGNKLLLESGDQALWLDFGTDFRLRAHYYNDLLAPRATAGLRDPLTLGLLPSIEGIYRSDLAGPMAALWPSLRESGGQAAETVAGFDPASPPPVLLSHAHLDHCGALSFLSAATPVYATAATAALLKACQDTAGGDLEGETAYLVPREDRDGLIVASNYRTTPAEARRIAVPDLNPRLAEFWKTPPATRGMSGPGLAGWQPARGIAGLDVKLLPVDHSVPGAAAWAVATEGGWVVYTGDFRRHGGRGCDTRAFMAEAARLKPLALICEGTHLAVDWPTTESAVYDNACHAAGQTDGLVIADFGPRNVERLETFRRVADATGRRLVLPPRAIYILEALSLVGATPDPRASKDLLVYGEAKAARPAWERALLDRYGDRVVAAPTIRRLPGEHIVCFDYYDLPQLIDIAPRSGTFIYSASEAWDEEERFDVDRLRFWLNRFGLRFAGDPASAADASFHASGHIDGPGLFELIAAAAPTWVVPVHTADTAFFRRNVAKSQLLLPKAGKRLRLA